MDDDSMSSTTGIQEPEDIDDLHPPVSPMTGAESFFLPQFNHSDVSAYALASEIRRSKNVGNRSVASSKYSVATDDFASACDNSLDLNCSDTEDNNNNVIPTTGIFNNSLFGKDVLVHTREPIPEDSLEYYDEDEDGIPRNIMSKATKTTTTSTTSDHTGPSDVAATVYGKAKDVYAWAKTVPVASTFLGVAEGVACKVVSVAGTSFEEIDGQIKPLLSTLDSKYVNPAISAVAGLIVTGVTKGDETFRPVIMTILGPVIGNREIENGNSSSSTSTSTTTTIPLKTSPEATNPEVSKPQASFTTKRR